MGRNESAFPFVVNYVIDEILSKHERCDLLRDGDKMKKQEWCDAEKIDWVYSQLEDEESRFIFDQRRQFSISGDYHYIHNIIDNYVQELSGYKWYPDKEQKLVKDIKKNKAIIFGAGLNGRKVWRICKNKVEIEFFCDNDLDKQGEKVEGIEVISLEKLLDIDTKDDYAIIVSPKYACGEIVNMLLDNGIKEEKIYKYIDYGTMSLDRVQYFDEKIISFKNNEVFVDGGAFDLGTSELFVKKCKSYRKIYAFEPDTKCYLKCKSNAEKIVGDINLACAGLWSEEGYAEFLTLGNGSSHIVLSEKPNLNTIKVVDLDSYINDDKVTFIKLDIEGAELKALKGAESLIKREKPKLAICLYHKAEDLWEIPFYVKKLVPEYKLYIRHYSNYECETVLYAVCEE